MNCMKCGRETSSEQVFCQECLLEMERYPVKPGTPVQLPRRQEAAPKKNGKRRILPLEDQVKVLRKRVRILTALLVLAFAIAIALAFPAVQYWKEDHFLPGQNYTSIPVVTASQGSMAETTG